MAYAVVEDFRGGVDRRSPRHSGTPGTLWVGKNVHVTRGGRIEKRKKLVAKYELPVGKTWGMKGAKGVPYVFGYENPGAFSPAIPSGVTYQKLLHPGISTTAIDDVLDVISFNGKQYVIVRFADDSIHHYYDGVRVTAWDDGVMTSWRNTLEQMAAHLASLINESSVVSASASGAVITITNRAVNVTTAITAAAENVSGGSNDQTATALVTVAAGVGTAQVATVTLAGTPEVGDRFAVTVGDTEYGAGDNPSTKATFGIALGTKLYLCAGSVVYFCGVSSPTVWRAGVTGAGFFNVTSSGKGSEDIVSVGEFQGGLAFLCQSFIQTWTVNADPDQNSMLRTVDNTGGVAVRAFVSAGNLDGYYLSPAGLKSLKQQASTGTPFAADVGDNIEPLIQSDLNTLSAETIAATKAAINPFDARTWFWLGTKIYVLSYYPQSKINAWTWYETGLTPGWMEPINNRLYLRSGDTIYVYGGDSGTDYDTDDSDIYYAEIEMPFMHAGRIADDKTATAYNIGGEGKWDVWMKTDPTDPDVEVALGRVDYFTYHEPEYAMGLESTHFAPRLKTVEPGAALLSTFSFDFEKA